ncbi:MAG: hypothetical protein HYZ11_09410 [Candidatus Tectomicrobia bacterium]|uniref:Uncharacterized protein n=1 Tax=Tectimicrobiota bacterium TaxID=2528274 RepID=A0A932HZA3_UNCTE|nr:hypothetical protein [Candidatus Tectomicrobia bacterium]
MMKVKEGQCGLCMHFAEGHINSEVKEIRKKKEAPEALVETCGHPQLSPLRLMVTPVSGCSGFERAA